MTARYCGGLGGTSRRHHSVKRGMRTRSNYRNALAKRGLVKAPALPALEYLRRRQATDDWLNAHPWIRDRLDPSG
jgi:hypothetical protein